MHKGNTRRTKDKRLTQSELSEKYGITRRAVCEKMNTHGFKPDAGKKYSEAEYLQADAMGKDMDKNRAAKKLASLEQGGEGDTLTAQLLRRKISLLDVDIETAKVKLLELKGKTIAVEKHNERVEAVARLMLSWWDKASENAATKVKDAGVLLALREAGDNARREILELD